MCSGRPGSWGCLPFDPPKAVSRTLLFEARIGQRGRAGGEQRGSTLENNKATEGNHMPGSVRWPKGTHMRWQQPLVFLIMQHDVIDGDDERRRSGSEAGTVPLCCRPNEKTERSRPLRTLCQTRAEEEVQVAVG
jgi:hypothetical protein